MGWICARVLCSLVIESKANFCFVWITDIILILFFFPLASAMRGWKKKKKVLAHWSFSNFASSDEEQRNNNDLRSSHARSYPPLLFPLFSSFHNVLSLFQLNVPCVCVYIYIYIYTLLSRFFLFSPPRLFQVCMCLRYFYRSAHFSSVMLYYCYPHVYCSTIVHAHFLWCSLHLFSFWVASV